MDEQTDRKFQLQKSIARQRALRDSISQELALYQQDTDGDAKKEEAAKPAEEKKELHEQIVETRVMIEDARQRIAYSLDRLSEDFHIDIDVKDYIVKAPIRSLLIGFAVGFYFGLKK